MSLFDLLLQFFGLVLLVGGLWFGYLRWIRPREASLNLEGKGMLLLLVLTLMGGFIGSPFWWVDEARSFAWDLPPLASRMLAAAGWTFTVACFLALQKPMRRRVRLILLLLSAYLTPLFLLLLFLHLDRLDFAAPITYAFLAIVLVMVTSTNWYVIRQPQIIPDESDDPPPSPIISAWLALIAIVTFAWGLALFITDNGPSDLIWAWPGDLLTTRLISVMLFAIAAGSVYSRRYADVSRMMLIIITAYGLGLSLSSLWNMLGGTPVKMAYLVVFGVLSLGSVVLLFFVGRSVPKHTSSALF